MSIRNSSMLCILLLLYSSQAADFRVLFVSAIKMLSAGGFYASGRCQCTKLIYLWGLTSFTTTLYDNLVFWPSAKVVDTCSPFLLLVTALYTASLPVLLYLTSVMSLLPHTEIPNLVPFIPAVVRTLIYICYMDQYIFVFFPNHL